MARQHQPSPVCIYVDDSNIFIGGQEAAQKRGEDPHQFRIDFTNFLWLITSGTQHFDEMVWAGSGAPELESIFEGIRSRGVDLQLIPRTVGGENETVDQAMQLAMYRHARKYRDSPGTMVLCTGDGKGLSEEKGFLYDLHGFVEDGWQLALFSWNANCHRHLRKFAREHGYFTALDRHYERISFIQHGRHAKPYRTKKPGQARLNNR